MTKCFLSYHNIISSLGFDTSSVFEQIKMGHSGLRPIDGLPHFCMSFFGDVIPTEQLNAAFTDLERPKKFTRLEHMLILSLSKTLKSSGIKLDHRVGLIISTTKGNIDVLEETSHFPKERARLGILGGIIKDYFGFLNDPIVLSNACVSGILAVSIAKRYLQENVYDHIFIVAGDIISDFVLSGFSSFHALSATACKPYDKDRAGINLGEAAASILVTTNHNFLCNDAVEILGEGSANDANHISGPSRTGEGLFRSVSSALQEAQFQADHIDYISAHGTATLYNDDMESIAFNRIGLQRTPLNSLKGYFGHTLGASGLLETIIGMQSLYHNTLIGSAGYENLGTSQPLNIIKKPTPKELNTFLKTASGFGGCNTAALFRKVFSQNHIYN